MKLCNTIGLDDMVIMQAKGNAIMPVLDVLRHKDAP